MYVPNIYDIILASILPIQLCFLCLFIFIDAVPSSNVSLACFFCKLTGYFCRSYLTLWGICKLIYWFIESIRVTKCNIGNRYFGDIEIMKKYWISIDPILFIPFIAKLKLLPINLHKYVNKKSSKTELDIDNFVL